MQTNVQCKNCAYLDVCVTENPAYRLDQDTSKSVCMTTLIYSTRAFECHINTKSSEPDVLLCPFKV